MPAVRDDNTDSGDGNNLRPKRSRKDRPCDHCRRSKRSCLIKVRGQSCDNCAKAGKECSFDGPPLNRHRKESDTPSTPGSSSRQRYLLPAKQEPHSPGYPIHHRDESSSSLGQLATAAAASSSAASASPWMAERSTLGGLARPVPVSNVSSFLDSLERDVSTTLSREDEQQQYSSLDAAEEESHYLGSGAVAQIASVSLDSRFEQDARVPYRQVADPRHPAFFLNNPSRVYGLSNAAFVAERAYEEVLGRIQRVDPSLPDRLIQHFMTQTVYALPVLNRGRLEASLQGSHGAAFPYAILVGIFASSAIYEPALRRHWKEIWGICVNMIDNEYRSARLQTLQLEILHLAGRPISNPGGNHLAICRAVGAMQLLGLHRDPSRWKLPKWERSLRKRLWWSLYILDKWNAYTYGRPMNMESTRSTIPPLTFDDGDDAGVTKPGDSEIAVFIALCRLTSVLESLLPLLLERDLSTRRHQHTERILLRHAASDLDSIYRDMPPGMEFDPAVAVTERPRPGLRSLQLSHIGIELFICRLGLEREEFETQHHLAHANQQTLRVVASMATFLECLRESDYSSFWNPWSAYQLTNAVTLLLQQVIRLQEAALTMPPGHRRALEASISDTMAVLARLVSAVQTSAPRWEVADAALPRIHSLVKSMPPIPGIGAVQDLIRDPGVIIGPTDWPPGTDVQPETDILALFDWLNGDMGSFM